MKRLEKARRLIERHSIGGFSALIAADYRDEWGFSAQDVKAAALEVMRHYPVIEIDLLEPSVEVVGDTAGVVCYARVVVQDEAGKRQELCREYTGGKPVKIELWKRDRGWLIGGVYRADADR